MGWREGGGRRRGTRECAELPPACAASALPHSRSVAHMWISSSLPVEHAHTTPLPRHDGEAGSRAPSQRPAWERRSSRQATSAAGSRQRLNLLVWACDSHEGASGMQRCSKRHFCCRMEFGGKCRRGRWPDATGRAGCLAHGRSPQPPPPCPMHLRAAQPQTCSPGMHSAPPVRAQEQPSPPGRRREAG